MRREKRDVEVEDEEENILVGFLWDFNSVYAFVESSECSVLWSFPTDAFHLSVRYVH